ncbi:uncharacterized protein [Epargyreus clarus]|uniref:uncharacterized protein n=1 Tax=Epargyreus clarus TaxID=520877 RepID=UPI003C2EDE5E
MSTVNNLMKFLKLLQFKKSPPVFQPTECFQYWRGFADKTKSETSSKQIVKMVQVQGPDKDERLRVRRARPADVPRILRFVRENARVAWPDFANPPPNLHLILGDYVARALAQGHSMLAEQQEPKRGWSLIRGLAISTAVCPWDAMMLENWAKCVRCKRSRQLVHFTAHCLQAPALHDKYRVHKILQVILIVPPDAPRATEVIHMLAKNTISRGREVGLPVLRFDVTNNPIARALDELNLIKEWEMSYNLLPNSLKERKDITMKEDLIDNKEELPEIKPKSKSQFIAVYTSTNNFKKS